MRYILPGMGATSAMYAGPWRSLPNTEFIDWPRNPQEFTFKSIASHLIGEYGIEPEDRLVGTSLGGIIALEIAALVGCSDVCLISSCRNRDEINQVLLALAPLSDVTPMKFIQLLVGKSGDLGQMFAEVDTEFVRGACRELGKWISPEVGAIELRRIHGSRDHVIPCPPDADLIIDGGHLIAITDAQKCVKFVSSYPA